MSVTETVTGTFTVKVTVTVTVTWNCVRDQKPHSVNVSGEVAVIVAVADSKLIQYMLQKQLQKLLLLRLR